MGNMATEVLEKQITKVQDEILQTKINIADLFVKIHNSNPFSNKDSEKFFDTIQEMEKMPKYLDKLAKDESKLEVLSKSKAEIEEFCCT